MNIKPKKTWDYNEHKTYWTRLIAQITIMSNSNLKFTTLKSSMWNFKVCQLNLFNTNISASFISIAYFYLILYKLYLVVRDMLLGCRKSFINGKYWRKVREGEANIFDKAIVSRVWWKASTAIDSRVPLMIQISAWGEIIARVLR